VLNKLPGMTAQVNFASNTASMQFPSGMLSLAMHRKPCARPVSPPRHRQMPRQYQPATNVRQDGKELAWFAASLLLTLPFLLDMLAMLFGWHG
jgi:Cu+-exporting ATPase